MSSESASTAAPPTVTDASGNTTQNPATNAHMHAKPHGHGHGHGHGHADHLMPAASSLTCGSLPNVSPSVQAEGGRRSPIDIMLCEPELAYAPTSVEQQLLDTNRFHTGAADITPAVGAMPASPPQGATAAPAHGAPPALNGVAAASVPDQ